MLDACVRAFADVLSMSVTLCSGILLKYLEVFKLPICSPIMERPGFDRCLGGCAGRRNGVGSCEEN